MVDYGADDGAFQLGDWMFIAGFRRVNSD